MQKILKKVEIIKNLNKNLHLFSKWIKLRREEFYFFCKIYKCKKKKMLYY